jgi:hypothetical protein
LSARTSIQVIAARRRQILAPPQAADTLPILGKLGRLQRNPAHTTRAGVRIDVPESLVLLAEVARELHQHQMFEHIGVVAGVEGVAIAEHRLMPPVRRSGGERRSQGTIRHLDLAVGTELVVVEDVLGAQQR